MCNNDNISMSFWFRRHICMRSNENSCVQLRICTHSVCLVSNEQLPALQLNDSLNSCFTPLDLNQLRLGEYHSQCAAKHREKKQNWMNSTDFYYYIFMSLLEGVKNCDEIRVFDEINRTLPWWVVGWEEQRDIQSTKWKEKRNKVTQPNRKLSFSYESNVEDVCAAN